MHSNTSLLYSVVHPGCLSWRVKILFMSMLLRKFSNGLKFRVGSWPLTSYWGSKTTGRCTDRRTLLLWLYNVIKLIDRPRTGSSMPRSLTKVVPLFPMALPIHFVQTLLLLLQDVSFSQPPCDIVCPCTACSLFSVRDSRTHRRDWDSQITLSSQ